MFTVLYYFAAASLSSFLLERLMRLFREPTREVVVRGPYDSMLFIIQKLRYSLFAQTGTFTKRDLERYLNKNGLSRSTLTHFTMPYGYTAIGPEVFSGCDSLTSIELPESLTQIGVGAFSDCHSLESIELPKNITIIGRAAFYDCRALTSVDLPAGLNEIGNLAFIGCTSLTSVNFPAGLNEIGGAAFFGSSIRCVTLPDGIASIGQNAFKLCTSLECIMTSQDYDWDILGIDRTQTKISKILVCLEQINMKNIDAGEYRLLSQLITDQDYQPNWETLSNTFSNRSISQIRSLLEYLGKNTEVLHQNTVSFRGCLFEPNHTLIECLTVQERDSLFNNSGENIVRSPTEEASQSDGAAWRSSSMNA